MCWITMPSLYPAEKPTTLLDPLPNYKRLSTTFDMPGWYCIYGEGVVTGKDMDVSDRHLNLLKAQAENLSAT